MDNETQIDGREEYELSGTETVTVRHNPQAETYLVIHEWDTERSLSASIVTAIEEISGVDSTELPPLFDRVNTDALDSLFEPTVSGQRRDSGRITFPFSGFLVTVHADGEIAIRPRREDTGRQ